MSKIKTCPACGKPGRAAAVWEHLVGCCTDPDCETQGPIRKSKDEALAAWNALPRKEDAKRYRAALSKLTNVVQRNREMVCGESLEALWLAADHARKILENAE